MKGGNNMRDIQNYEERKEEGSNKVNVNKKE